MTHGRFLHIPITADRSKPLDVLWQAPTKTSANQRCARGVPPNVREGEPAQVLLAGSTGAEPPTLEICRNRATVSLNARWAVSMS